jgi:hypothetical protein
MDDIFRLERYVISMEKLMLKKFLKPGSHQSYPLMAKKFLKAESGLENSPNP